MSPMQDTCCVKAAVGLHQLQRQLVCPGMQIVGKISPWILPDSHNEALRRDSESALRQELEWAAHLSLQACVLPVPPSVDNSNYARIILQVGEPACTAELVRCSHLHYHIPRLSLLSCITALSE